MNSIIRQVFRSPVLKSWAAAQTNFIVSGHGARSFSCLSKSLTTPLMFKNQHKIGCQCGCGPRFAHTKSEIELAEFLTDEIANEKQLVNSQLLRELSGFNINYDGSVVKLTKQAGPEKIVITFNVNHTVDSEQSEFEELEEHKQSPAMSSKPNFDVDITKGDVTLGLSCTFLQTPAQEQQYDEVFGIEEITIYQGELKENSYACSGDVLDGDLYNLLLSVLDEKGITNEFVQELANVSTDYEHSSYIKLLESLRAFCGNKK